MAEQFPIMAGCRLEEHIKKLRESSVPFLVVSMPWSMIAPHERQAQRNHSQTLKRLAERGGLSACEALAILDDRDWQRMDFAQAHTELAKRVTAALAHPDGRTEEAGKDGV